MHHLIKTSFPQPKTSLAEGLHTWTSYHQQVPLFCCSIFKAIFSCLSRAFSFWSLCITSIALLRIPALFIWNNKWIHIADLRSVLSIPSKDWTYLAQHLPSGKLFSTICHPQSDLDQTAVIINTTTLHMTYMHCVRIKGCVSKMLNSYTVHCAKEWHLMGQTIQQQNKCISKLHYHFFLFLLVICIVFEFYWQKTKI